MGKPDAPAPPDPRQTSAAQTGTNVSTAIANAVLGNMDQVTPYGTLTYERVGGDVPDIVTNPSGGGRFGFGRSYSVGDQTFRNRADAERYRSEQSGDFSWTDPYTGETYSIPRYRAVTELNPEQQATLDANQAAQGNLASLAEERSGFLREYLPQTGAITDEIDNRLYEYGRQRLDPRFARQEEDLRTRLANQGIAPGSEAYNREMELMNQGRNDAYNQLMLQGRGTALNEVNMPINQVTALLSGSQVQNPNVQIANQPQMPTTDVAGLINQNYNQQMANYQQEMGAYNGLMGGLFGLGSRAITGGLFG